MRVTIQNEEDEVSLRKWFTEDNGGRISSYFIVAENRDSNYHWHIAFSCTYKNLASLRRAIQHRFPHWDGNKYYSLTQWADDGCLRYMCKAGGKGDVPDVIAKSMIDLDVVELNKQYYEVGDEMKMSKGVPKEWMPDLLNKLRKNGLDFSKDPDRFRIFEELIRVCPGVSESQLVTYMLKIRRALDTHEFTQGMWIRICDKIY